MMFLSSLLSICNITCFCSMVVTMITEFKKSGTITKVTIAGVGNFYCTAGRMNFTGLLAGRQNLIFKLYT